MRIIGSALVLLVVFGCSNVERLDTTAVKEVMESHEIKKITEADIMTALDKKGLQLAAKVDSVACGTRRAYVKSLTETEKFGLEEVNPKAYTSVFDKDQQMVEALLYELENQHAVAPTPQKLNDSLFAFYFTTLCVGKDTLTELWKLTIDRSTLIQGMK